MTDTSPVIAKPLVANGQWRSGTVLVMRFTDEEHIFWLEYNSANDLLVAVINDHFTDPAPWVTRIKPLVEKHGIGGTLKSMPPMRSSQNPEFRLDGTNRKYVEHGLPVKGGQVVYSDKLAKLNSI